MLCKEESVLLKCDHQHVDQRYVVDGVRDHASLIVQRLRIPHIVADADAPAEEQCLANRHTVVPPVVRALHKLKTMFVLDLCTIMIGRRRSEEFI